MLLIGSDIGHPWKFEPFKPTLIICTSIHSSSRVEPNYQNSSLNQKLETSNPSFILILHVKNPLLPRFQEKNLRMQKSARLGECYFDLKGKTRMKDGKSKENK